MPSAGFLDPHDAGAGARVAVEERCQLFGHGAGQLVGVGDRNRAVVIAGHVVADADGQQFDLLVLEFPESKLATEAKRISDALVKAGF